MSILDSYFTFSQILTGQILELLLWYDKCVFLDCHLHRDRYYSRTADCWNRLVLQSELHSATVALFPYIPSDQRVCPTLQHHVVEAVALDS
jgi:hypothetical protein